MVRKVVGRKVLRLLDMIVNCNPIQVMKKYFNFYKKYTVYYTFSHLKRPFYWTKK